MGESALLLAVYGVLLGARHALEPDHLAAVSTMAAHGSSRADVIGVSAAWGAGHATLITVVGILLAVLRWELPPWMSGHADLLVGVVLISFGVWTLWSVHSDRLHIHRHAHGARPAHTHFHLHGADPAHDDHPPHPNWMRRPTTAYAMGTLHGLAGSGAAAALAVLVAPSRGAVAIYLLSFGTGSLLGMVAVGAFALWPVIRVSARAARTRRLVQGLAGVASIAVGVLLLAS